MTEKPKPTISQFEEDGILKPVAETAGKIALSLGSQGYDYMLRPYNNSLLILLTETNHITTPTYNTIVEDFTQPGVIISFNEDEQIIRVAPIRN